MPELGTAHGRVELEKDVTGIYFLPVADMDATHDASLERLDGLRAAARNDLAGCHSDNVDRANAGPGQRNAERDDDGHRNGAPNRRGRSLDDFEGGWQKGELVLSTHFALLRKGDNVLSGPHAALPAADRALHIGHPS